MKRIIPKEDRIKELISFGFPQIFIRNIGQIPELAYQVENVDNAYFYLPTISHYRILKDPSLIPIFGCGERFYVVAFDDKSKRIIYFELENDEIYRDYGKNWKLLLMDVMTDYFDLNIEEGIDHEKFISVGEKIGFDQSEGLFRLRNLPVEAYNEKFENDAQWRIEIAKALKIV